MTGAVRKKRRRDAVVNIDVHLSWAVVIRLLSKVEL